VRGAERRTWDPSAKRDRRLGRQDHQGGPERGYDGAKRLAGRKRHILVNTNGFVLGACAHGTDLPDRDGGRHLLTESPRPELFRMELVWATCAYTAGFRKWAELELGWRVEVLHRRDRQLWRNGPAKLGEAAWLLGSTPLPDGREDVRVAEPVSSSEQGLRAATRGDRSHNLRRDEPTGAAQSSERSGVKGTHRHPICRSQNSF
jgi:hypothetical protein